jgi:hypothetical protein
LWRYSGAVSIKFAALDTRFSQIDGPAECGVVDSNNLESGLSSESWKPVLRAEFIQAAAGSYLPSYLQNQISYQGVCDVRAVYEPMNIIEELKNELYR